MSRWPSSFAAFALANIIGGHALAASKDAGKAQARSTHPTHPTRPKSRPRDQFPSIALFGAHVGEALMYRPFDERGRTRKDAAKALEKLLRCRQTGAHHRLAAGLGDALYQIGRHFPGHRIEIFSGYRPRAFCNRAHSRHMTGSAIDFHVDGVDNETLIAYLRKAFHPAGVGFYPHGVHVHLDVERRVDTYWVDPGPPSADPQIAAPTESSEPSEIPAARDTAPLAVEEAEPEPAELPRPPAEAPLGEPPMADPAIDPTAAPAAAATEEEAIR